MCLSMFSVPMNLHLVTDVVLIFFFLQNSSVSSMVVKLLLVLEDKAPNATRFFLKAFGYH